ncbi:MAG: hypothetical protein H0W72_07300 [Planctomycetes bacterium]|nr:hypothetical protein [Planctomycetota bacterium]
MPSPDLSDQLKQFVSRSINSVEQLEVLLLLKRDAQREWTADALSREISTSRYAAEGRLLDLRARGLATFREDGQLLHFRYLAGADDAVVTELAAAYVERRTSIITMIFSKPNDSIGSFADAFRLRRPPEQK